MKSSLLSFAGFLLLAVNSQNSPSSSPAFAADLIRYADEPETKEILERNKILVGVFVSIGGEKLKFKSDATFSEFNRDGKLRWSGTFAVDKPVQQKDGKVFIRATLTLPNGGYFWIRVKDKDNIENMNVFGNDYTREKPA